MIPIFRLEYNTEFRDQFKAQVEEIFDQAFLTNHDFVRRFETEFAAWNHSPFALMTSSGTAALECILRALNVRDHEVILPANTFMATAAAVKNAGGRTVIADIEPEYLAISPRAVLQKISPRTKAVVVVHIGGTISPAVDELRKICDHQGVALIEDCAHAHGASLDGIRAGQFGLAGAFSFHVTKVMTTGEGGACVTSSLDFAQKLESTRQFGKDRSNALLHGPEGGNGKMTEMQALMGILELQRVDARIAQRQALAAQYQRRLQGSPWKTYAPAASGVSPYYKQIIIGPMPWAAVREKMQQHGISITGGVYNFPLHRQPAFSLDPELFPVSDRFGRMHICPPCYPELKAQEVDFICDRLLELSGN